MDYFLSLFLDPLCDFLGLAVKELDHAFDLSLERDHMFLVLFQQFGRNLHLQSLLNPVQQCIKVLDLLQQLLLSDPLLRLLRHFLRLNRSLLGRLLWLHGWLLFGLSEWLLLLGLSEWLLLLGLNEWLLLGLNEWRRDWGRGRR